MIATFVHIWVKETFVDAFIEATIENQQHSVKEKGNLRFDILRDADFPSKFVLYEVFKDEQTVTEHKTTAHYMKWKDTVAEWMQKPRQGMKHFVVYPTDESQW
jgi:autoinducer 2-degrading protein